MNKRTRAIAPLWLLPPLFLSGAAALVAELCWLRKLSVLLGGSSTALDIVLVTFMTGLALGAREARRVVRHLDPLLAYALLELALGTYIFLSPYLFTVLASVLAGLQPQLGHETLVANLCRLLASGAMLLAPTLAMGMTTPLLITAAVARVRDTADRAALLYGVNTLGGALGAFVAGASLILALGVDRTLRFAAALNLLSALLAASVLLLAGRRAALEQEPEPLLPHHGSMEPAYGLLAAASGFLGMALEVALARLLLFTVGGSYYSHTVILSGFLLGIVLGSLAVAVFARRARPHPAHVPALLFVTSLGTLASLWLFERLPLLLQRWIVEAQLVALHPLAIKLIAVLALVAVPAAASGILLPYLVHLQHARAGHVSQASSRIFFLNTLGGAAGAGAAGFLLIGWLGVRGTLLTLAAGALALGLWATRGAAAAGGGGVRSALACASLAALGLALARGGTPLITHAVAYTELERPEVLFHREGRSASVAVVEVAGGDRVLFVNGLTERDKSGVEAEPADVALLSLPAARDVFVAGLGSGRSAGVAGLYPHVRVNVVEIAPGVVRALPFFDGVTGDASRNPQVRVQVGDARHYLRVTRERFDVVLPDVFLSSVTGTAELYSVEFFQLCAARLAAGGRVAISTSLDAKGLDGVIAAGFLKVFPFVRAFQVQASVPWVLLGSLEPLRLPPEPIDGRGSPTLQRRLETLGLAGRPLAALDSVERAGLEQLLGKEQLSTDDRPVVDFLGSLEPGLALTW
jgi:predicted membrane-bound spermidine synthase